MARGAAVKIAGTAGVTEAGRQKSSWPHLGKTMSHPANDKIIDFVSEKMDEMKRKNIEKLSPQQLIEYLYDFHQKEKTPRLGSVWRNYTMNPLEYLINKFGPRMMPEKRRRWKYDPLANKLRHAANSLDRVGRVAQAMEQAKKDNPNHLIF